ncbi:MAG: type II toxin-antitoxin system YafQ family toxin [Rickettsiales bacterium]|jgi:mRNA interferase YafQ
MLIVRQSNVFKRDLKRLKRGSFDLSKLEIVVLKLINEEKLEPKYSDHLLIGNWKSYRECHIAPNWLLIYHIKDKELLLARTGSHSELF